jgi:hypothetical protein
MPASACTAVKFSRASPEADDGGGLDGICKWFDLKRLYGLIEILDDWDDLVVGEFLFVKSACIGPIPWKGSRVTFQLGDAPASSRHPFVAVEVRRIDEFQARAPIPSEYLADWQKDEAHV